MHGFIAHLPRAKTEPDECYGNETLLASHETLPSLFINILPHSKIKYP